MEAFRTALTPKIRKELIAVLDEKDFGPSMQTILRRHSVPETVARPFLKCPISILAKLQGYFV